MAVYVRSTRCLVLMLGMVLPGWPAIMDIDDAYPMELRDRERSPGEAKHAPVAAAPPYRSAGMQISTIWGANSPKMKPQTPKSSLSQLKENEAIEQEEVVYLCEVAYPLQSVYTSGLQHPRRLTMIMHAATSMAVDSQDPLATSTSMR